MTSKEEIRQIIKAQILSLSIDEITLKSSKINEQLLSLPIINQAKSIALYASTTYEVQTLNLINIFLENKILVHLPKIINNHIELRQINSISQLFTESYNILEPDDPCILSNLDSIDVIILPCVGIDRQGNRIGHGKGFYDKFLSPHKNIPTICLAFQEQIIEKSPAEKHDIPIDIIITEDQIIFCKQNKTKIIDGKKLAQDLISIIKQTIYREQIQATLAVIQVGDNPASTLYVSMKQKACEEAGIKTTIFPLPDSTSQNDIEILLHQLNQRLDITGILVQLPLPNHLNTEKIINLVDPLKDIDGLSSTNRKNLKDGNEVLVCCTPKGILKLLEMSQISLTNKKVCLIGNGFLVGNPLACMLKNRNVVFFICDKDTKNIQEKTRQADIIITATGIPHLIDHNYLKQGAIIIDAGTAKLDQKVVGDVNFHNVLSKVEKITPVPGGVGPMTIATLMENIIESYNLQKQISSSINQSYFSSIAIVTSQESWFIPYAQKFEASLKNHKLNAKLFFKYEDIDNNPEVVFLLSCFSLVPSAELKKYKHNLVVHESSLPQGKGWAPLFWQILEGKNNIPIVLFEAAENIDAGPIYLRDTIALNGNELHDEIREIQAKKTLELCYNFLVNYSKIIPQKQTGIETFYPKRTPKQSELDPTKPLNDLFNQLRIASNDSYPAFFHHQGEKYIIKIIKEKNPSN